MNIRRIKEKDFDSWLKLRYYLWPYHTLDELEQEMKTIYKSFDVSNIGFIAEEGDKAIGFIELSIHESAPGCSTNNVGFIEGWYVQSEFRGKGVGKLLVEQGEAWAISNGCKEMASDTTERYPISPLAHRALGYEEVEIPLNYRKTLVV